jgi:ketosteroid isomerase-like protein
MTPAGIVRELVDAYNAKSLERLLALYRPDARFWDPFHRDGVAGREAIAEVLRGFFAAFPDERMEIRTLCAEGDYAVAEFASTGTTAGGERFELEFTEVYQVYDEQIASCRVYIDTRQVPS